MWSPPLDGEQALKKARDLLPKLIILDLMLPEVDGIEVAKSSAAINANFRIPIIMLTAKAARWIASLGWS